MHACVLSHFSSVQLFATLWTVAHKAALSMGFSRQEHWSGVPCPPAGDLPDSKIKPVSLKTLSLADGFFTSNVSGDIFFLKVFFFSSSQNIQGIDLRYLFFRELSGYHYYHKHNKCTKLVDLICLSAP